MRPYREAIVLAGGFGTRLAHVVPDVCKPMAPVAGRPFLRFIIDQLAAAGFDRAVEAGGYRCEQIEGFFGSAYRGTAIEYSPEDTPLLTGGAVKRALSRCESDWVFVLNGDTWLDVDFAAMEVAAADAPDSVSAVIAVKRMRDFDRYGTVDVDAEGALTAFHEKRPCEEDLINAGVYLLRRDALHDMPEKFSLESDYFERVVGAGALRAVECPGGFIDIGVPGDYELAQTMLAPLSKSWKLAMFDRDGTINVDTGHLHEPEKLELIPSTIDIMRGYSDDPDFKVVVGVTRRESPRVSTPRPTCAAFIATWKTSWRSLACTWTLGTSARTTPTTPVPANAVSRIRGCCWMRFVISMLRRIIVLCTVICLVMNKLHSILIYIFVGLKMRCFRDRFTCVRKL